MKMLINRSYLLVKYAFIFLAYLIISSSQVFGQEWSQITAVSDSTFNSVYFTDRNMGWAVGNNGAIIHTSDGGDTWTNQNSRTSEHLNSVYFFDEFTGWIAGNNNLVLFTENGGEQWVERRPSSVSDQDIKDILFADWKRGWAVGGPGGHIYYTDNSGLTWQRQTSVSADGTVNSIYTHNHETFYAIFGNQITFADGQGNWEEIQFLTESDFFTAEDLFFIDEENGWVVGNDQSGGKFFKTEDGGNQWEEIKFISDGEFRSIIFSENEKGFVVGTGGTLLHTSNGGASWEVIESGTEKDLNDITFADPGNGWIVGTDGILLRFLDSEIPDISYYKSHYPSVQLSDDTEAELLLLRGQKYGNAAQAYDDPRMRMPQYGRLLAAIEIVDQYVGNNQNDISTQAEIILNHFWAVEHNEGAELFNEMAEENGDSHQIEKSRYHLQNAIHIQPDSAVSYLSLAFVNHRLNDIPQAISAMESAIDRMEVPEVDHYIFLVELYHSQQQLSDGIELNKEAIEAYPEEYALYETIVDLFLNQGEIEEAVRYLNILIQEFPENPSYYFVRGAQLQYIALNMLEESLRLYEEVWALREELVSEPQPSEERKIEDQITKLLQEVDVLKNEGNGLANQAVSDMEKLAELNLGSLEIYGIIGSLYHNKASILYQMRTLTPDQEEAQQFDSTIADNLDKAREHYERALTQNPDESSYWEALYYIYLDLGMEEQAEQIVRNEYFKN